jgi:hypothetical protein
MERYNFQNELIDQDGCKAFHIVPRAEMQEMHQDGQSG